MEKEQFYVGQFFKVLPVARIRDHEDNSYCEIVGISLEGFEYKAIFNFELDSYVPSDEIRSASYNSYFAHKKTRLLTEEEKTTILVEIEKEKNRKPLVFSKKVTAFLHYAQGHGSPIPAALKVHKRTTSTFANYIGITSEGFTFLPDGKELLLDDNGEWSTKGRQTMKFSKLVRKLFRQEGTFSDSQYESFSNHSKAFIGINGDDFGNGKYPLEILEGEDIRKAYNGDNYTSQFSNGNAIYGSCMRDSSKQSFFDIYVNNPTIIKMLVMKDSHQKIAARAILWLVNDKVYMDRIYGTDAFVQLFKNHATENGWYYKEQQSNTSGFDRWGDKSVQNQVIEVPVHFSFKWKFPYMDTLIYLDIVKRSMTNKEPYGNKYLKLRDQHGGRNIGNDDGVYLVDPGFWRCQATGSWYPDSDVENRVDLDYIYQGNRTVGSFHKQYTRFSQVENRYLYYDHVIQMYYSEDYVCRNNKEYLIYSNRAYHRTTECSIVSGAHYPNRLLDEKIAQGWVDRKKPTPQPPASELPF